jgi:uncharacterized damage-inducible protein DinB
VLNSIFDGWQGYQTSLLRAIEPLTAEQLRWRPAPHRRSIGELVRHICLGRITWFARMQAPGIDAACDRVPQWFTDGDNNRHADEGAVAADDAAQLIEWLKLSWLPVQRVLDEWSVEDLTVSYPHRFARTDFLISRQWTIWRIMAHDIHHGGQLALLLALLGIDAVDLRTYGGHIVEPPRTATLEEELHG